MTTPPSTKRSVGRPRKNAKKQENPDCEVATKGYVKCVARKLDGDNHTSDKMGDSALVWMIIAAGALLTCIMLHLCPKDALVVIGIPALFFLHDMVVSFLLFRTSSELSFMQKHEEPPCEPRRGCEE